MVQTVLGKKPADELGLTLAHEHICCYFEYFRQMLGDRYLDMALLEEKAIGHLKEMKAVYGLSTFVDCTPVNIGRDISLLKRVSEASGVNIVASTGFYYTDEEMLRGLSSENILRHVIEDAAVNPIGLIKFAAEWEELSPLNEKLLDILCEAQKTLALPFCIHSNAQNQNALKVLEFVLKRGVRPETLTIAHCSDTRDLAFLEEILRTGCYIGFDRIYPIENDDYPAEKRWISMLWQKKAGPTGSFCPTTARPSTASSTRRISAPRSPTAIFSAGSSRPWRRSDSPGWISTGC